MIFGRGMNGGDTSLYFLLIRLIKILTTPSFVYLVHGHFKKPYYHRNGTCGLPLDSHRCS